MADNEIAAVENGHQLGRPKTFPAVAGDGHGEPAAAGLAGAVMVYYVVALALYKSGACACWKG